MKLGILIPTLDERVDLFNRLTGELTKQMNEVDPEGKDVCFIWHRDNKEWTTGAKRNFLIQMAVERKCEYIAFHDDDDLPGPTYIKRGLEVAESGLDCGELFGQYYENGKKNNPFHHSLKYDHWYQDAQMFYRNPNHLNFLRLDKVKDIKYPDITVGEDGQYSIALQKAGVLKTEYPIPEIIYYYYAGNPKHEL